MTGLIEHILHVPSWLALLIVFAVPALEASIFLGFIFPGEIACLLGGVLASESKLSLTLVIVAAILGAVIGDSIGYEIGARYGETLLRKLPNRLVKPEHIEKARDLVGRLGGRAVFVGRFTAALRALVPGFAGLSTMTYRRFLFFNAAGGILWAGGVVIAGYLAGSAWKRVAGDISLVGYGLLAVVVVAGVVAWVIRRRHNHRNDAPAGS
jgi:membrane-associated protein